MPVPYVPGENVAQVEVIANALGVTMENTLYFQYSGGISAAELKGLCNDVCATWNSEHRLVMGAFLQVTQVYGTDLTTDTSPTANADDLLPFVGTVESDPLPLTNTLSISFRSAARGRSGRGRNYWMGLAESQVQGNFVLNTPAVVMQEAYEAMRGQDAVRDGWIWGVFSRRVNGAWRTAGLFRPITSVVVPALRVCSQDGRIS